MKNRSHGLRAAEARPYIPDLGPENVALTSDLGEPGRVTDADLFNGSGCPRPAAASSQAEIDMTTKRNPARFLGLSESDARGLRLFPSIVKGAGRNIYAISSGRFASSTPS